MLLEPPRQRRRAPKKRRAAYSFLGAAPIPATSEALTLSGASQANTVPVLGFEPTGLHAVSNNLLQLSRCADAATDTNGQDRSPLLRRRRCRLPTRSGQLSPDLYCCRCACRSIRARALVSTVLGHTDLYVGGGHFSPMTSFWPASAKGQYKGHRNQDREHARK
jgi:hypothetical protein